VRSGLSGAFGKFIQRSGVKAAGKMTLTIGCKFLQKLNGHIIDEDPADTSQIIFDSRFIRRVVKLLTPLSSLRLVFLYRLLIIIMFLRYTQVEVLHMNLYSFVIYFTLSGSVQNNQSSTPRKVLDS